MSNYSTPLSNNSKGLNHRYTVTTSDREQAIQNKIDELRGDRAGKPISYTEMGYTLEQWKRLKSIAKDNARVCYSRQLRLDAEKALGQEIQQDELEIARQSLITAYHAPAAEKAEVTELEVIPPARPSMWIWEVLDNGVKHQVQVTSQGISAYSPNCTVKHLNTVARAITKMYNGIIPMYLSNAVSDRIIPCGTKCGAWG
jgi:hypothetical protein